MLLYGCFYIAVSGPLIQYLKTFNKFSFGAELQPIRASHTMSFPKTCRFLEAGPGGGWGCDPEQLAAMVPCANVYSGCITMVMHTQLLAVCCKYSRTLWCSGGSPADLNNIILHIDIYIIRYIITAIICVHLQTTL